jgi:hypothetical protein
MCEDAQVIVRRISGCCSEFHDEALIANDGIDGFREQTYWQQAR